MLSPEQIMIVGFIASAITLILKMLFDWFDVHPGRAVLSVILYVIALLLGGLWTGVVLPPFPPFVDPVTFAAAVLQFVAALLAMVAPVVGLATLIYNLLYEKVIVPLTVKVEAWHVAKFAK